MHAPDAVVTAVLRTLVRATADARVPVVLRTRRPEQAQALAEWLNAVHGSGRLVITSTCAPALIEVRLPARMHWPATPGRMPAGPPGLADGESGHHLSRMILLSPPHGAR